MQTRVESFVLFRFHFFSCLFFIFTTDDLMLRERGQRLSISDKKSFSKNGVKKVNSAR